MAQNMFEQYGIKEVADVQFEALEDDDRLGVKKGDIVLYLDTLKVSTIETTAEQTEATGGKGNVPLIIWDYGREVTLTLEDALFSPASLAVMMGGAGVEATTANPVTVRYTQDVASVDATNSKIALEHKNLVASKDAQGVDEYVVRILDMSAGARGVVKATTVQALEQALAALGTDADTVIDEGVVTTIQAGHKLKLFYDVKAGANTKDAAYQITIDSQTFPGTYKVYGDTVVRNTNGADTAFQFVLPKAKVGSEVTFTMEAAGDPTTFEMSLRVLRTDDHEMIKLIKYNLADEDKSDKT